MDGLRNALLRCWLAERKTSPFLNAPKPDPKFFNEAKKRGLIEWRNGMRLTAAGNAELGEMTIERAVQEYRDAIHGAK